MGIRIRHPLRFVYILYFIAKLLNTYHTSLPFSSCHQLLHRVHGIMKKRMETLKCNLYLVLLTHSRINMWLKILLAKPVAMYPY
jgi:hypothetical protein